VALCLCVPHLKHSLLQMAVVPGLRGTSVALVIMSPVLLLAVHWAICHLYIAWPASVSGWCGYVLSLCWVAIFSASVASGHVGQFLTATNMLGFS
jgi:hypothetical protein